MSVKNMLLWCGLVLLLLLCGAQASGQCMPGAEIKPESGYSYMREEVKVLNSMRRALADSDKLSDPPLFKNDPQRIHKEVEFYSALHAVEDDYSCAEFLLQPFAESKNSSIHESVSALLLGIKTMKETNSNLTEIMEMVKKTNNMEDLDKLEVGKKLADLTSIQKDARTLVILGVKMSTLAIIKYEGDGENTKPIAFTISSTQHATIVSDLRQLSKKEKTETYIDLCIEGLIKILLKPLSFQSN